MRHLVVQVFNELNKLNEFLSYYHHEDVKEIIIKNIEYDGGETILIQYYVVTYEDYELEEV